MAADDDHSDNAPAPKSTETAADTEAETPSDEASEGVKTADDDHDGDDAKAADDADAKASGETDSEAKDDDDNANANAADDDDKAGGETESEAKADEAVGRIAEEPSGPPRSHRYGLVIGIAAVLLALDLISKQWAWDTLRDGTVVTVIDGWAYYEFGFNTGSAFSLLRDASWSRMFFIGITLAALLYMGHLAKSLPTRFGSAFVAIGMVASGALGNLHDRFVRVMPVDGVDRHGVVDFIKVFYWEGKPWPTFNIADVALVAGVLLLLTFLWRHGDVLDAPQEQAKS